MVANVSNIFYFCIKISIKMRRIPQLMRFYPLSWLCIAIIWVACFCTPPHTSLDDVPFMDKWTHILMYAGTCSVIWLEHLHRYRSSASPRCLLLWAWLAPVMMSGLIELLQAYCTGGRRSGDWLDFLANATGATLGCLLGYLVYRVKYNR